MRSRLFPRDDAERLSEAVTLASDTPVACHAGIRPSSTPTTSVAAAQNGFATQVEPGVSAAGSNPDGISAGAAWKRHLLLRGADAEARYPAE